MLFGKGIHDIANTSQDESYKVWSSMLRRAYSEVYHKKKPSYVGVSVCEDWLTYSNFLVWFSKNYVEGYELDKDILSKGNRVYSPSTCCFVPPEINSALIAKTSKTSLPIGVYFNKRHGRYCSQFSRSDGCKRKTTYLGLFSTPEEAFAEYKVYKQKYIKELAIKFKDCICNEAYEALINHNIEITD